MALLMALGSSAIAADTAPRPHYGRDRLRPDYVAPASDGKGPPRPTAPPLVDVPPPVSSNGQGTTDAELGRGFVGAISHRLELLQAMEGLVPRGVPVAALHAPPPSQPKAVRFYEQLATLQGAELIEALQQVG
ncbi:MAG: hypothetical protein H7Z43_09270, partial [Clostridia bacterium]|nr:hypothetical protein [Deltaproteobacteria bacterium]